MRTATKLTRISGYSAIGCGALTSVFWLIHPSAADPKAIHGPEYWDAVASGRFAGTNGMFVVILVLSLLAIVGIYERGSNRAGQGWLAGFLAAFIGTALFVAAGAFNALVAPVLASNAGTRFLLEQSGPLLSGPFAAAVASGGILFGLGYVVIGYKIFRGAALLPSAAGLMLVLSSPILGLSPLMPLLARAIGSAVWGLANIWVGLALLGQRQGESERAHG